MSNSYIDILLFHATKLFLSLTSPSKQINTFHENMLPIFLRKKVE